MKKIKRHLPTLLWAMIFIFAAYRCFADAKSNQGFNIFFDGWWTFFVIAPAVCDIINRGFKSGNITCLMSGGLLFLLLQDYSQQSPLNKYIFPIILLIAGMGIVFSGLSSGKQNQNSFEENTETVFISAFHSRLCTFTEASRAVHGIAIFGKLTVDLSELSLDENVQITVNALFGNVTVILPQGYGASAEGLRVISGCKNEAAAAEGKALPVDYNCIFGSVDIVSR